MARKPTGTIQLVGDHYRARVTVADGNRPWIDLPPGLSESDARKKVADIAGRVRKGEPVEAFRKTRKITGYVERRGGEPRYVRLRINGVNKRIPLPEGCTEDFAQQKRAQWAELANQGQLKAVEQSAEVIQASPDAVRAQLKEARAENVNLRTELSALSSELEWIALAQTAIEVPHEPAVPPTATVLRANVELSRTVQLLRAAACQAVEALRGDPTYRKVYTALKKALRHDAAPGRVATSADAAE